MVQCVPDKILGSNWALVVSLIVAFTIEYFPYPHYFEIMKIVSFLPYFLMGYRMRKMGINIGDIGFSSKLFSITFF